MSKKTTPNIYIFWCRFFFLSFSTGSPDYPDELLMQILTHLSLEESRALVHRFLDRVVDIRGERAPKDIELQESDRMIKILRRACKDQSDLHNHKYQHLSRQAKQKQREKEKEQKKLQVRTIVVISGDRFCWYRSFSYLSKVWSHQ